MKEMPGSVASGTHCIIYREITNKNDKEKFQKHLETLVEVGGGKWDENKSR